MEEVLNPLDPDSAAYTAWLISAQGDATTLVAAGEDPQLVALLAGIAFLKLEQQPVYLGVRDAEDWIASVGYMGMPEGPPMQAEEGRYVADEEIPPSQEEGPTA